MRYIIFTLLLFSTSAFGQKFVSEKSMVTFFSDAAIEDITAENTKSSSIFNSSNAEIVFSIPVKDFQFHKALMQEHFNEKYMETEKFPKATFQGKLIDFNSQTEGVQQVKAQGKLTVHGVAKDVEIPGTVEIAGKKLIMKSKFMIVLEDYQVMRPQMLWQNIAEQVEVTIEFNYKSL